MVTCTINGKEIKFELEVDENATDREVDEEVREEVLDMFGVEWEEA